MLLCVLWGATAEEELEPLPELPDLSISRVEGVAPVCVLWGITAVEEPEPRPELPDLSMSRVEGVAPV
ncbi:MAG: hypothetical protein WC637_13730, partial [Victivallales bacterium]